MYMCISNENLKENVEILKNEGYKYILKAKDKMLSGWGSAGNRNHIHLIACKTENEMETIKKDLYNDKTMSCVDWNYIDDYKAIYNWTRNKSWTLRNDWTRCF